MSRCLRWHLDYPPDLRRSLERAADPIQQAGGCVVPMPLVKLPSFPPKPRLFPDLQPYWNVFWDLMRQRRLGGFATGGIPLAEVREYCDFFGIEDRIERENTAAAILWMDAEYLAYVREQAKADAAAREQELRDRQRLPR